MQNFIMIGLVYIYKNRVSAINTETTNSFGFYRGHTIFIYIRIIILNSKENLIKSNKSKTISKFVFP